MSGGPPKERSSTRNGRVPTSTRRQDQQRHRHQHGAPPGSRTVRTVGSPSVPDVVIPVLDEAEAIGSVVRAMPDGYRAIVVDNGSTDGSGDHRARTRAPSWSPSRAGGSARRAGPGCRRADGGHRLLHGRRRLARSRASAPRRGAGRARSDADLVMGRRVAERGAWPLHARLANRALAWELRRRSGIPLRDLGPMRAMRRQALLDLGMRGPPLRLAARDGGQGPGRRLADRPRSTSRTPSERAGRRSPARCRGTLRTVRDMSRILAEIGWPDAAHPPESHQRKDQTDLARW